VALSHIHYVDIEMTAREDVFATFELLEAILLAVHHRDLLVSALLVSRTWYHTIISSRPLQWRLFLAPAPPETPWVQNPILASKFWPFFHDVRRISGFVWEDSTEQWGKIFQIFGPFQRHQLTGMRGLEAMGCFSDASREVRYNEWRQILNRILEV
jgi:hypothetical protein